MEDENSSRDLQSRKRVREGGSEKLNYSQRRAVKWKSKVVRADIARKEQTQAKAKASAQQKKLKDADRKTVEGLLEKAKRELRKAKKDPELAKEKREKIKEHIADLQYINHFPGGLYIPLFDLPAEDPDLKEKLIAKRNKLRDRVNRDLANLARPDDGGDPDVSAGEGGDDLGGEKTADGSKEERDPFFLYSDEEDDQSLTEAKPLTGEDLWQKRRKFGEFGFYGRNRGGGRGRHGGGGRGWGRGRFDNNRHAESEHYQRRQENGTGWRGGRGRGRGRGRGQAHS